MTPPGVIGTAAVRLERAAEIRSSEKRHPIGDAEFLGRLIKRVHALTELGEKIILRRQLVAMRVVTADRAEVNLAAHSQRVTHGDDLSNHFELIAQIGVGGKRCVQCDAGKRVGQQSIVGDCAIGDFGELGLKKILVRQV